MLLTTLVVNLKQDLRLSLHAQDLAKVEFAAEAFLLFIAEYPHETPHQLESDSLMN